MKTSVSLKLDEELLEEIDQLVTKEMGRSAVIRELLRYGLAAHSTKGSLVVPAPIAQRVQTLDDAEVLVEQPLARVEVNPLPKRSTRGFADPANL